LPTPFIRTASYVSGHLLVAEAMMSVMAGAIVDERPA